MAKQWLPWQQLKDNSFLGILWPGIYHIASGKFSKG